MPVIVLVDNKPFVDVTESLSSQSSRTKRCKHFLMLISSQQEMVGQSDENLADVLIFYQSRALVRRMLKRVSKFGVLQI